MEQDANNSQTRPLDDLLREGIAAAQSGQREVARDLLMRVVEQDEENVLAWLWMADVVDSLEDREICLENVLTLDPDHAAARKRLDWVRKQKEIQVPSPVATVPSTDPARESPVMMRARTPISPAAAILRKESGARHPPPKATPAPPPPPSRGAGRPQEELVDRETLQSLPEPQAPPPPLEDAFADEYLCPYCAAQTQPEDRKCAPCGGDLWARFRRRERRSTALLGMLAFQFFSTFTLSAIPLLLILFSGVLAMGLPDPPSLSDPPAIIQAYREFPSPSEVVRAGVAAMPGYVLRLSVMPGLFSALIFVGLVLRWRPIYYLLIADAVCWLFGAVASVVLAQSAISGATGVAMAAVKLLFVFQLEDDFTWEKRRILLRLDEGLSGGIDFLARGNFYAKRKMWALAALHLRRAVGSLPRRLDCYSALAVAYIRLEYDDRAARILAKASRISPGNPRVEELKGLLDELRSSDSSR